MPHPGKKEPRPLLFETEPLELARPGKLQFVKLLKNGVCQFDTFLQQLSREGGYDKEVDTAINIMDQRARLKHLPGGKHHDLGVHSFSIRSRVYEVRMYEIKTKSLRIYYFHQPPSDEVVVLMGKKNEQDSSISSFTSLISQYLTFLHSQSKS